MASSAEAAAHIDLSRVAFAELIAKGVIKKPDKRGGYDLTEVRLAYIRHMRKIASGRAGGSGADRLTEQRVRLARAKAEREERQNNIERGEVARVALIVRHLQTMMLMMRDRLLSLAGETADACAMRDRVEVYEVIDAKVREALEWLADPENAAKQAAAVGTKDTAELRDDHNDEEDEDALDAT